MKMLINSKNIDWESSQSYYYFNEKHPQASVLKDLASQCPFFKGSIYLFTSSYQKICILSKEALLASAQAVHQHLDIQPKEKWLLSLPLFHVGGLSILARSFVGKNPAVLGRPWNPDLWIQQLEEEKINLTSLVPAQVYDVVKKQFKAPKRLRAVVVGGDFLSESLYQKARSLNWPLLPSYGLTEASSQVATAELSSLNHKEKYPPLKILSHINIRENSEGLWLQSSSLLKGYFYRQENMFKDPKDHEGWFLLEDVGQKQGEYLKIQGRKAEQIKILGEWVDFKKLSELLKDLSFSLPYQYELLATPNERNTYEFNLVTTSFDLKAICNLQKKFNQSVFPYEKIKKIYCVSKIEKKMVAKISQKNLREQVGL
ncbi:MAG: AMP-binding protein [Bdellovibrionales bacterium]